MPTNRLGDQIEQMENLLNHYTRLPHPSLGLFIAFWIANTYSFEEFRYCGYLGLRSATPQCGKTKLLRLIAALANGNPRVMTCPTAAVLYRCGRRVLLIDEVDRLRNQDRETFGAVLSVLNSGFEQGSVIERTERVARTTRSTVTDGFEPRSYPIYGPKAFAGIEGLADTLADRTFFIQMSRSPIRTPRLNMNRMDSRFGEVRDKLAQWLITNRVTIEDLYQRLPDEVPELRSFDDRFQDISEPLYVLAKLADAERENDSNPLLPRLLEALHIVAGRRIRSERERGIVRLLETVMDKMTERTDEVFISTDSLIHHCARAAELSWITSGTSLAKFLGHFGMSPTRSSDGNCRGYMFRRDWINQLIDSYGNRLSGNFKPESREGVPPLVSAEVSEGRSGREDSVFSEVSEQDAVLTA